MHGNHENGQESIPFHTAVRQTKRRRILPVFIPFLGCPGHCVFCAQDRQTGKKNASDIQSILNDAYHSIILQKFQAAMKNELAFYGGTFTSLPHADRAACFSLLRTLREKGIVDSARCSTRPDALPPFVLEELHRNGIGLVELGIQSFNDDALSLSRRGYSGTQAQNGCKAILEHNLKLGIQLLPGMPGSTPQIFLNDVRTAIDLSPSCLRFYPCLVPDGTELADWFRKKIFLPWSLEETVKTLGEALKLAWQAQIPVIRLSVAPEMAFDSSLLAGPRHPALGALIQAEALLLSVEDALHALGRSPRKLILPKACQGFMYGDRGRLKPRWTSLGLGPEKLSFDEKSSTAVLS